MPTTFTPHQRLPLISRLENNYGFSQGGRARVLPCQRRIASAALNRRAVIDFHVDRARDDNPRRFIFSSRSDENSRRIAEGRQARARRNPRIMIEGSRLQAPPYPHGIGIQCERER